MKKNFLSALLCVCFGTALFAQENTKPAKETIKDDAIVYPESMTEQLSKLLHDWQLDFSKTTSDCKRGSNVLFQDTIYTNRLQSLPTEMELSFNHVVKSYIDMYAGRKRDQVSYMLALGEYYFPMFEEALDRHGLPLELKYLPVIESALNPIAVSRVGATGLWQFMLRTGQGYGLEVNSLVDERRDPYKATEAAVRYLGDLYRIYGDWNLVIAAYNCGPGNVNKAIARSGGKRDYWEIYYQLPRETRGYVPAFIAANYIMNYYTDHNICPIQSFGTMTALDTVHVKEQVHFEQIAGVLDVPVSELRRLNPQFKKDLIPGGNNTYSLVLPTQKMYVFVEKEEEITLHNKERYLTHRSNTDRYLNDLGTSSSGNTANVYYRVKRGDNLSTIARRNGVTVAQIKSWNGLRSNNIVAGRRLVVKKRAVAPQAAPREQMAQAGKSTSSGSVATSTVNQYYRVKKGDTLGEIARKHKVTVSQLQAWNGMKSTRLSVGKQLVVGKKITETAPKEDETNYSHVKSSGNGSNVISDYLKKQIDATEPTMGEVTDIESDSE